jgi:predicted lactoylglutathione lyase
MSLGAFSLSLTVKDIKVSLDFYEKLGFTKFHGDIDQKWLILQNGDVTIGLFEGMFEKNIMTFNPGWDDNAEEVNPFTDVRDIQKDLQEKGIEFIQTVEESSEGPGNFIIMDPDGNPIMLDQHR